MKNFLLTHFAKTLLKTTLIGVFGILVIAFFPLLGCMHGGMEWIDENGLGNGYAKHININGKDFGTFRFEDYWNTNGIYRFSFWANDLQNCECVKLSATKRDRNGLVLFSDQVKLHFTEDRANGKALGGMEAILSDGFTPKKNGESLMLGFILEGRGVSGDKEAMTTNLLFKAQRVTYPPSI